MRRRPLPARVLWIVDREALDRSLVHAALRGGVRWLYLRDPSVSATDWRNALAGWRRSGGAPVAVVSGAPDWAREAGLGAHLKAAQPSLETAERACWPLLGRSVHDEREVRQSRGDDPDYLVAGPVFPTASKPGHPGIGRDGLSAIVAVAGDCPVLAVGGVEPERVATIVRAGAAGIVVRSGLTSAADPIARARAYAAALDAAFLPVDPG